MHFDRAYLDLFRESPLACAVETEHPDMEPHAHEFDELVLIACGEGRHEAGGTDYGFAAGDVFVVPRGMRHAYRDMEGVTLYNVLYDFDHMGMANWDARDLPGFRALFALEPAARERNEFRGRLHLTAHRLHEALIHLRALNEELEEERPGFRVAAFGRFMQLAAFLGRCYEEQEEPSSEALLRISRAIGFMEEHFRNPLSVRELADAEHTSVRTLQRLFREALDTTPTQYLRRLRIEHAASLLRERRCTVTEAAYASGFNDSNYFSQLFREITGVTPTAYRRSEDERHGLDDFPADDDGGMSLPFPAARSESTP
ncbi:helix-turn-helix domain-containing protein [Kiritimatiella glycovorans]|uniref:AraC family transcriptional regulator n=1 Tax=Kiritimatiella glycovorans TaxID=1307763 RepID=A0A0G3EJQ4_9BACT|nr:helix-turn-helix domain-containing protein [Kiritimatiella glycovorans]AKJ65677.1 AraC family transcriptional regulator [Kiritimatiella glycovorans]